MRTHAASGQQGFTLVELIIVIVILGILAAVAVPVYSTMKQKGNRTDAISALTRAAQMQERWYSDNGTYTGSGADIDMPATTENGHYNLAITFNAGTPDEFTITATATGPQQQDKSCDKFMIDQAGRKTSTDSAGNPSTSCWPN